MTPPDRDATLSETRAVPPTAPDVSPRRSWAAEDALPPTSEKPPEAPVESTPQPRDEPVLQPLSHKATQFYTLSYLVFFSIFGTLARLGLQALTFYPGAPVVTGVLWANVGGSLLMGFFLEDKNLFREEWGSPTANSHPSDNNEAAKQHKTVKKTIPLYIGLTTGFCGCFTSFSSFIRDIFLALTNDLSTPSPSPSNDPIPSRNGGYSFMALLAVILTTVALSLGALIFGSHLALALDPITPTFPFRFTRRYLDPLFGLLGWGCWLGAVFLAIWPPRSPQSRHGSLARPSRCFLRFYLSLALNARLPAFPLGTFVVNIFGTIILAMCYDLQHVGGIGTALGAVAATSSILTSCQVLQGVMDGFCGSATTISTWVAELNGLSKRRYSYFYGLVSVAVALGFFVILAGSLGWTKGFVEPVCG
ncbi:putative chromosome condensation protein [Aspergillus sclerotioniger CBS 115572]|uniref:Putative chromosome condensation protein n=1 Tax=Aspergillus sclerotioniger CBS 115572 TaxID=1450535 RepID=A0A317WYS3_9EURO|nr:putative chromosome condensation protein [Aspergillus sclerotioniger CBS 115572]PWY91544.1 putative chromosome condensation protein [Aspergillus sclerotioniger CBS 115572]